MENLFCGCVGQTLLRITCLFDWTTHPGEACQEHEGLINSKATVAPRFPPGSGCMLTDTSSGNGWKLEVAHLLTIMTVD